MKGRVSKINSELSDLHYEVRDKIIEIAKAYFKSELDSGSDEPNGYLDSFELAGSLLELRFLDEYRGETWSNHLSIPIKYLCENGVQLIKEDSEKKKVEIENAAKQKELKLLQELKEKYE